MIIMELASSSCSALAIILLFVAHAVFPVESVIPFPFGIGEVQYNYVMYKPTEATLP